MRTWFQWARSVSSRSGSWRFNAPGSAVATDRTIRTAPVPTANEVGLPLCTIAPRTSAAADQLVGRMTKEHNLVNAAHARLAMPLCSSTTICRSPRRDPIVSAPGYLLCDEPSVPSIDDPMTRLFDPFSCLDVLALQRCNAMVRMIERSRRRREGLLRRRL